MTSWKTTPILKVFIPFILGFILAIQFNQLYVGYEIVCLMMLFVIILRFLKSSTLTKSTKTISIYLVFFLLGIQTINKHDIHRIKNHYIEKISDSDVLIGRVSSVPIFKEKTSLILDILSIKNNKGTVPASGKLQTYLTPNADTNRVQYGDVLLINGKVRSIPSPMNPYSFDYQNFMETKGILAQVYISENHWKITQKGKPSLVKFTNKLRNKFREILETYIPTPRERSVALALILGNKTTLSKETKIKYAITGSMHILAVSGLHVGLIFVLIHFLLRNFTSRNRLALILKISIQFLGIWLFVFITGSSVSVIRAGIMFSFIVLGKSLSLKTNTYNSILASVIFILIFDPMQIKTVGFQLSYLAVISIIWLHPKIKRLLQFKNIILKYLWELTAVSIAAQILVLPLGIFYFHQFPIYFWLSSWFVIPLATVVLYLGIFLFLVIFIPSLASVIGFLLYWSIWVLNAIVNLIHQLPWNHIGQIWIENYELILIYILIILGTKAILNKKMKWLTISMALFCLLISFKIYSKFQKIDSQFSIIYHVPKYSVLESKNGNQAFSITTANDEKLNYATATNRMKNHYKIENLNQIDTIIQTTNYLHFKNFVFQENDAYFLLDKNNNIEQVENEFPAKIIVTDNCKFDMTAIQSSTKNPLLILDSSNHPNQNDAWDLLANIRNFQTYNVTRTGAYFTNQN